MNSLPEEILVDILDYLQPNDVVAAQRVCQRLSKTAHDNGLWRYKCFEKSPSASAVAASRPNILATLTDSLGGLSLGEPLSQPDASSSIPHNSERAARASRRAQAVADWDCSGPLERVDWYSEYIGRCAPLTMEWLPDRSATQTTEIRGIASLNGMDKVIGQLDDGSMCVWDINSALSARRKFREIGRSKPGALFSDNHKLQDALVVDCVNADPRHGKAYAAVGGVLNEIDLNTLQVVAQHNYAWPITALSQQTDYDLPLTVGTPWSLHIHDCRAPSQKLPQPSADHLDKDLPSLESSVAFLPNYTKGPEYVQPSWETSSVLSTMPRTSGAPPSPSFRSPDLAESPRSGLYARIEPGPLSILHYADNEILIAGRFPSILSYDRRFFPRLGYVIHSSARLSALSSIPQPPTGATSKTNAAATLVACGEYGGCGSLELYSLPHVRPSKPNTEHGSSESMFISSPQDELFSYKNRQQASSSKLLSVATQGTKIVFSDAEGGLKWVERDGRSLIRRWNINGLQTNQRGAMLTGDLVARKIIPLDTTNSERGERGDGDLMVWTGEKVGIVTSKPQFTDHEELVKEFEEKMDLREQEEREKNEQYSRMMRNALERQADERRWMSQFRLKRGLF